MITIQIVTKNNEKTIEKTLNSIISLKPKIIIGDIGSSDSTLKICSRYDTEIRELDWSYDYSKIRNSLIDPDSINMMIEPWEVLLKGHEDLFDCEGNHNVTVIRSNSAVKELRVWKGLGFKNPVYETLEDNEAGFLDQVVIFSSGSPDKRKEESEICEKWRALRPTDLEPWYYSAFCSLSMGKYEEFLSYAERYMAMTSKFGPAEVQVCYRMAQILASKNLKKAASLAVKCLASHPTFAEFWCLLGDLFLKNKEYIKAKSMYLNAIEIGARRASQDSHPIEIDKYKKYPESMLKNIEEMDKRTGVIVVDKH